MPPSAPTASLPRWPIPELPSLWHSSTDPSTGQPYFWHAERPGEAQWTVPKAAGSVPSVFSGEAAKRVRMAIPSSQGGTRGGRGPIRLGLQRRRQEPREAPAIIDPLDPTGTGGKWSDGLSKRA